MKNLKLGIIFLLFINSFILGVSLPFVKDGECILIEDSAACGSIYSGTSYAWNLAFVLGSTTYYNMNYFKNTSLYMQESSPPIYKIGVDEANARIFHFKISNSDNNPWGFEWDCQSNNVCNIVEREITSQNLGLICEKVAPNANRQSCSIIFEAGSGLPRNVCSGSGCSASNNFLPTYSYICGSKSEIVAFKNLLAKNFIAFDRESRTLLVGQGKKFRIDQAGSKVKYILNGSTMRLSGDRITRLSNSDKNKLAKSCGFQ